MRRTRRGRSGVVAARAVVTRVAARAATAGALVVACLGATTLADAQEQRAEFVELKDVVAQTAMAGTPDRLLFFPLDDSFERCIPLRAACPEDSSTLMLVPAADRRLTWRPEGGDLHLVDLDAPPVRAIGAAPERQSIVRYLVPVLEGSGIQLFHMPRRYADGRLVRDAAAPGNGGGSDADAARREAVTPVLASSLLSTAQPSPPPQRLLETPALIDASELADAVPAMFVRRSAPSRIVFGLRPDPTWGLDTSYVPLLDDGVIALGGRHRDRIGLAVPAPADLDDEAVDRLRRSDSAGAEEPDDQGPQWVWPLGAVVVMLAAGAAGAAAARARGRRGREDRSAGP